MFVALSVLLQVIWICVQAMKLNRYSTWISVATSVLTLVVVILLYGRRTNAAFKMPWIILILAFPVLGLGMYLLFGRKEATQLVRERFERIDQSLDGLLIQDKAVRIKLQQTDRMAANEAAYIWNYAKYPIYQNTDVVFYKEASEGIEAQKQALNQAKHFIFMEYHAIEDKQSFGELKEILARKAKEGVEVRLFYDDIGSIGFINTDFIQRMEAEGIQCRVFNRLMPVLNVFMNNRDHRKITVIDGKIGFTGGYNLADEYFNITHPYGYWKDTGVRIDGAGAWGFASQFIQMWKMIGRSLPNEDDYYRPRVEIEGTGWCQPFTDGPLNNPDNPIEDTYLQLIASAQKMLYITTPYYAVEESMQKALCIAADAGVDVRLVVPAIPDKKYVYMVAETYWGELLAHGVKIYRYTPGFVHAKSVMVDREVALVGSTNMDYRTFQLHYECAVLLYHMPAVEDLLEDMDRMVAQSAPYTLAEWNQRSWLRKMCASLLRLVAIWF